jgi:heat shock protein HslJ
MRKLGTARHLHFLSALLVMVLLLSGCTGVIVPSTTPGATPGSEQPAAETDPLANTSWQLSAIQSDEGETPVVAGSTVTLEFAAEGQVGGNGGCNTFGGTYQVQGDSLIFGELVSTLMACLDEQIQQQERQFLDALQSAQRFEVSADQLTVWFDDGNSQLIFVPLSAEPTDSESTEAEETVEPQTPDSSATGEGGVVVAERVAFEGGDNTATLSGTLAAGEEKQYAISASAGQLIHVEAVSADAPISVTVYAPGGESWPGEAQAGDTNVVAAEVTAPAHGDYLVVLSTSPDATDADYEVSFVIDSTVQPPTPQPGPVDRIFFEADGTAVERSGLMPSGPGVQQYLISANSGRTLTVDASSDGTPLSLTVESPSGNQWIPEMMPAPEGYTIGIQFELPEPGYYLVTLTKADHTPSTNYTITFTLE